ncbi:MAG: carboxymuconolactone decarboxylase family protein [Alphaproteobacteria bacterium]|nr:carboxymuconolactone decarboxylase family protein [Alphaproteobacteria bacterium]
MRIEPKSLKDYPWYLRPFFSGQIKKYGSILNSSLLWARSPMLFLGLSFLYRALDRKSSPISPTLRSLIIVRVSQLNGCVFCIDLNSSILLQRGVTVSKVEELGNWRKSMLFNDIEKIVLDYTEAITITESRVSEDLFKSLKNFFNEDQIIELTATIAFQNMSTKFNTALDISPQGFCPIKNNLSAS